MDKIVIEGGKPLRGEVKISGAKNAALPLICAALLAPGRHRFHNVPSLRDIDTIENLLASLGAQISRGDDLFEIDTTAVDRFEAPYDMVRKMRASVLVLGPLLARFGRARVSLPGGCAIGARGARSGERENRGQCRTSGPTAQGRHAGSSSRWQQRA